MALEKWLVSEPKVIDLELVRTVKVSLIGGKVDIVAHDEPGARVEVHSVSGKDLRVEIDGDHLEIDHPQLRWDNFIEVFSSFKGRAKADVSIAIPRNARLTFGVVSASALISGLQQDAKLSTVNGDLVIDGVTGDLEINTVTGEVSVSGHEGAARAHTVSGDITASGRFRRFTSDGVSGDVFLDALGPVSEVNNNTVSGDLTVRLDADLSAVYTVNTVSGTIQVDDVLVKGMMGRGYSSSTGPLDGTFAELRANSVSGNVTVVRAAAQSADAAAAGDADGTQGDAGRADDGSIPAPSGGAA